MRRLRKVFKLRYNEGIFTHLVAVVLLGFVDAANLFELAHVVLVAVDFGIFGREILTSKVVQVVILFYLAVKVPNEDSVLEAYCDYLIVVTRIEHHCTYGVRVSDEALEEEGIGFLGFIVPYLDHVVLSSRQEVPGVRGNAD